jgi:photosystem II stability/assembly factor-like uncharacterized protein
MKKYLCVLLSISLLVVLIPAVAASAGTATAVSAPCPDYFPQNPLPMQDWTQLSAADANTAWAVSLGGLILKSTDGCQTWNPQWSQAQVIAQQPPLRNVFALDKNVVWICGDAGCVLVTTDGGATWNAQSVGADVELYGITALSAQVAWAVGQGGVTYKTTDGGASWAPLPDPAGTDLRDISMIDAGHAWTCGDSSHVAYTADGGTTWTASDTGTFAGFTKVKAFSATKVYLVGDSGDFLSTTDGGTNWTSINLGSKVELYGMSFVDQNTGWVSGNKTYSSGFLAKTVDGGAHWQPFSPNNLATERNMTAVTAITGDIAWTCSVDGALARTTDGGAHWPRADSSITQSGLVSVTVIDNRAAWAAGENGCIARTNNGGRTWGLQASGTSAFLACIDSVSASTAWAVGGNGTILHTTDSGRTWTPQTSGTGLDLASVAAVDASNAWACGSDNVLGVVLHTTDGGKTWTKQKQLPGSGIDSIAAFDTKNAWFGEVSSGGGNIYATHDGGTTWTPTVIHPGAPVQHVGHIRDIRPINASVALALAETVASVDYFMNVYKTTDGGAHWGLVGHHFAFANADLFHLASVDGQNILSCGALEDPYSEPTVAFKSTDSGGSFNLQKTFHRTVMFGIDTVDGSTAWMAGYSGTIYRTTCPSVYSVSPGEGFNGAPVQIANMTGSGFWDGMRVWIQKGSTKREATGVSVASPYDATCTLNLDGLPEGAYDVVTQNTNGQVSVLAGGFNVTSPNVWFLAEGSTGTAANGAFETWVEVENPGAAAAHVNLTYMTPSGTIAGPAMTVPAGSRQTINVADTVPNQFSVSTKVTSDKPIGVQRTMYWNGAGQKRTCGAGSIGVNTASNQWYLAEGSTGSDARGSFETWVLVQNPGTEKAAVSLTYLTPQGSVKGPDLTLEPGTRQSVNVADKVPGEWSVSTVVNSNKPVTAERSMYWDAPGVQRQAGLNSIGTPAASSQWYLAEGSTAASGNGSFETWITLENPFQDAANAQLYYQTSGGRIAGPNVTLEPFTRRTVMVSERVPNDWSVSTQVVADAPVIAERSTYWNAGQFRQVGHCSIGATAPFTSWLIPEGSTGSSPDGGFETWILVQNPSDQTANVQLTYMLPDRTVAGPQLVLPPNSRRSVSVAATVQNNWSVSTRVTSDVAVMAEGSMYWNTPGLYRQAGESSKGVALFGLK